MSRGRVTAETLTEPEPIDTKSRRGGMLADSVRPALVAILDQWEDHCGQWYVIARYEQPTSADWGEVGIRKRVDQLGLKLPKGNWWEFATDGGNVLARIANDECDLPSVGRPVGEDYPPPDCVYGYPVTQLRSFLSDEEFNELAESVDGFSTSLCSGQNFDPERQKYSYSGCGPHGDVITVDVVIDLLT